MSAPPNDESFVDALQSPPTCASGGNGDAPVAAPVPDMQLVVMTTVEAAAAVTAAAAIAGIGIINVQMDNQGDTVSELQMSALGGAASAVEPIPQ
jgi:hypothetical protein